MIRIPICTMWAPGSLRSTLRITARILFYIRPTILLKEAGTDPIKRAGIIRDIVESIAKIPDEIKASVFIRECSHLLQVEERTLLSELNKMRAGEV